jgi:dTDP-4-dehydrorhamnose reductase
LPDPVDLYGRLKLAGEVCDEPHLTVRTSFIGLEPPPAKGLLGWFLEQKGEVQGYRRCIWSGLTAVALARILLDLAFRPEVTGLLHIAGEAIDKASLLRMAAHAFHKNDVKISEVDVPSFDRTLRSVRSETLKLCIPGLRPMMEELAGTVENQ